MPDNDPTQGETDTTFSVQELVDIMNFDPFAAPTTTTTKEEQPAQPPATTQENQPPTTTQDQPVPAPQGEPGRDDRLATAIEALTTKVNQPAPTQPAKQTVDPAAGARQLEERLNTLYNFQLTPKQISQMQSEDPNEVNEAVSGAMQNVAKLVHRNVANEVQQAFAQVLTRIVPQSIERALAIYHDRSVMNADFYAHFPELSAPELGDVVRAQAEKLRTETGATVWNADFRDKLGNACLKLLNIQRQPAAKPTPKAPNMLPSATTRPASPTANSGEANSEADIHSTLFG